MHHSPEEIQRQTRDLDTAMTLLVDILKRKNRGKDISKDETTILHKFRPKPNSA